MTSTMTPRDMTLLYLGMADDIWSVLSMNIDAGIVNLYVIDKFDDAYGYTLEGQREDIRSMITNGNNHCIDRRTADVCARHKGQIISEVIADNTWRLEFQYGATTFRMCVYTRDFMQDWPEEIRNIDCVLCIGSSSWDDFLVPTYLQMMTSRTSPCFDVIALTFLHKHFHVHYAVTDRYGNTEHISRMQVTRLADGSLDLSRVLDPRHCDGTWGMDKYGDFVPIELVTDPEHNSRPTVEEIMGHRC